MKFKAAITGCLIVLFYLGCTVPFHAQEATVTSSDKEIKVRKHTVLGQYEPAMVVPAEERIQWKADRIANIEKKREIIDTLDISDRKRRMLLKELYRSPFTYKWDKVLANIQAEDEDEDDQ